MRWLFGQRWAKIIRWAIWEEDRGRGYDKVEEINEKDLDVESKKNND